MKKGKELKKVQLKLLKLTDIKESKTNPRKTYSDQNLKELGESIKSQGLLQPILVRPSGSKYEIICGHRRFKASKLAKLKDISANVVEMSDEEAFEAQIVENLERKDVHPLEEAEAFNIMLESEKYTIADIAVKLSRSESFIAKRLRFVSLIPEIKQDFYDNKLGVGHAIELARLSNEDQKTIRSGYFEGFGSEGWGTVQDLKDEISGELRELRQAPFNTEDKNLVKSAGACSVCPKRSGSNPLLFDDIEQKDLCFDGSCYNSKIEASILNQIEEYQMGVGPMAFAMSKYDSKEEIPANVYKKILENKIPILYTYDDFQPHKEGELEVLYLTGFNIGKIAKVTPTSKGSSKSGEDLTSNSSINEQISKIDARLSRGLELDNEKVEKALREFIDNQKDNKIYNGKPLNRNKVEMAAFVTSVYRSFSGDNEKWLNKKLGVSSYDYNMRKLWDKALKKLTPAIFYEVVRRFVYSQLTKGEVSNRENWGSSQAFYELVGEYYSKEREEIQENQDLKRDKRVAAAKKRKEKLKSEAAAEDKN